MGVSVAVSVAVEVRVRVSVGVIVAVLVAVAVGVGVCVGVVVGEVVTVCVAVGAGVCVPVLVGVWVGVSVGVPVGVSVGVPVAVEVEEGVSVGVSVGVTLGVDGAKVTVHPAVLTEIEFPSVSVSLMICSPSAPDNPADPRALNVTRATLASPIGDVRLAALNAEIGVMPLANAAVLAIGAPPNSVVVPPAIEAIDTTVWS